MKINTKSKVIDIILIIVMIVLFVFLLSQIKVG